MRRNHKKSRQKYVLNKMIFKKIKIFLIKIPVKFALFHQIVCGKLHFVIEDPNCQRV